MRLPTLLIAACLLWPLFSLADQAIATVYETALPFAGEL
jgi:hypothetical protein